jgi:hypothetical protein
MARVILQSTIWALIRWQHGVIARWQLLEFGLTDEAIEHRIATARLHRLWPGVYAVGRPEVSRLGMWMAATLACGKHAALSGPSAATLLGIRRDYPGVIEVSIPQQAVRRHPGIRVRRRAELHPVKYRNIPVTTTVDTLVDLAATLDKGPLEAAVNQADKLDLIDPEALREKIGDIRRPGAGELRKVLDRATFVYTDSDLERAFLPLARKAGMGKPHTQVNLGAGRTDFYFDGVIVECDGLRYHRTPFTQGKDLVRNNAHMLQRAITLRFSHAQIRYEPGYVVATLSAARRPPAAARR